MRYINITNTAESGASSVNIDLPCNNSTFNSQLSTVYSNKKVADFFAAKGVTPKADKLYATYKLSDKLLFESSFNIKDASKANYFAKLLDDLQERSLEEDFLKIIGYTSFKNLSDAYSALLNFYSEKVTPISTEVPSEYTLRRIDSTLLKLQEATTLDWEIVDTVKEEKGSMQYLASNPFLNTQVFLDYPQVNQVTALVEIAFPKKSFKNRTSCSLFLTKSFEVVTSSLSDTIEIINEIASPTGLLR